ncbi:transposase family protein [Accumulibacter sp.]|uniref:transposase family protein n=1 Tax=Accumulibacter sp. TaxID=2053492 RepID=UPI0004493445
MTLVETFSGLPDSRRGPAKRYVLMEIVVMAVCAVLCGADNWAEVADWCRDRQQWLRERFGWSLKGGTPSHDTFGDLFRVLDAKVFEERFRQWIAGLVGVVDGCERNCWAGSLSFKPPCVEAPPSAFPNKLPRVGYVA